MSKTERPSIYDQLRPHLDAEDLLARLGISIVRKLGSEAYCNPLCHDSTSGESLQVNLHTGRWNCKACQHSGVYGDLIQLVEYVLARGQAPSHGTTQGASESHREAIRWLCGQFGIPYDERGKVGDAALDVVHLFAMLAHRHLLTGAPHVLEWIREKWGFDLATVESYGLGYMPDPVLPELARESSQASSREAFRSSGVGFYPTGSHEFVTRFAGRIVFPYLEHGRAVYLIGRATPFTPELEPGKPAPKYHKLTVHSDTRPHVSPRITNDHLYNETVMSSAERVVVAEGVADAVALSALGVPVVSPVTISFNDVDLERFVSRAREQGTRRVEILFDNELSGSGQFGARRVGLKLAERGLVASVLTLPLGPSQSAARDEVLRILGDEGFAELEAADPRRRKEIIAEGRDAAGIEWLTRQVSASKIDAAEWVADCGAGAAGKFDEVRRKGVDVVVLLARDIAKQVDPETDPATRLGAFVEAIGFAAHVDDTMAREGYASDIAKLAGKGVTKAHVAQRIREVRKNHVEPRRKEEKAEAAKVENRPPDLVLLPPSSTHVAPSAPAAPAAPQDPSAPAAPPPPAAKVESEHVRLEPVRRAVTKSIELKVPDEQVGQYVSQTLVVSMGYVAFRTPEELYLIRGSERVPVGLDKYTPRFLSLLYLAAGLTPKRTSHRPYIDATIYFLGADARRVEDVSWSHVGEEREVYFPTGDSEGRILCIRPGRVDRTRMAEAKVPAVAGSDFRPFVYTEAEGGIEEAMRVFRWTSIPERERMVLLYWIACLPVLRRTGTVPIVRIEGGSSSGKTRAVDSVSLLVNGGKSSSVPTAAALISRLSVEMLTIDDNRESSDVSPAFLGTMLQATHLGAREKRKANTDTGTVVERVCGALLMNGIEPVHDGRSEIASRMLTIRCDPSFRVDDSPRSNDVLASEVLRVRSAFWSDAARRCSRALELDLVHGETMAEQVEAVFGETRIGRLSAYLRLMVFAWIAGQPRELQDEQARQLPQTWAEAFGGLGKVALDSLIREELVVQAVRYVFAHGQAISEAVDPMAPERTAFEGLFQWDPTDGAACLGPLRATRLARLVRTAGRELNGPRALTYDLRAGQLEARLLDGLGFLQAAGFELVVDETRGGRRRFTVYRHATKPSDASEDPWSAPGWSAP